MRYVKVTVSPMAGWISFGVNVNPLLAPTWTVQFTPITRGAAMRAAETIERRRIVVEIQVWIVVEFFALLKYSYDAACSGAAVFEPGKLDMRSLSPDAKRFALSVA